MASGGSKLGVMHASLLSKARIAHTTGTTHEEEEYVNQVSSLQGNLSLQLPAVWDSTPVLQGYPWTGNHYINISAKISAVRFPLALDRPVAKFLWHCPN